MGTVQITDYHGPPDLKALLCACSYLGFGLMAGRAAVLSHEEVVNANPCIPTGHSVRSTFMSLICISLN